MSNENPENWPFRPSHTSSTLRGVCLALMDVIQEEGGGEISRRGYLKLYSLGLMAELLSGEVSHFFAGQLGEAEDMLALIEDKWVAKRSE